MLASSLETVLRTMTHNLDAELAALTLSLPNDLALPASPDHQSSTANRPETILILKFVEAYGSDKALISRKITRIADQCLSFIRRFGDGPMTILRAPARINILGEHVDYVSYIPTASLTFGSRQHDMVMMFRPSPSGLVRGASTDVRFEDFQFDITSGPAAAPSGHLESEWQSYLYSGRVPAPSWANYIIGSCKFAQMKYGSRIAAGFDFLVDSSVPAAGGASSSSALTVLSGAAIRIVNGIEYEGGELAMDSSRAEWYVGTRGGSMDHTTICRALPDSAIGISYSDNRWTTVPLPSAGYSWITLFTQGANKGQEVMNEYNERALVSRILIPAILNDWRSTSPSLSRMFAEGVTQFGAGNVDGLGLIELAIGELPESIGPDRMRESYPAAWEESNQAFPSLISGRAQRDFTVRKRALHHVREVKRVALAREILNSAGGREETEPTRTGSAMTEIGKLLLESHSSLRDLYGVSTEEVEALIGIIEGSGLACGARMMGGGFGGNILALAAESECGSLIDLVQQRYYFPRNRDGVREGSVMVSTPGSGLSEIA